MTLNFLTKVPMDAALQSWKFANATQEIHNPQPTLEDYGQIRDDWRYKDKVAKLLGMYSWKIMHSDQHMAKPEENLRKIAAWEIFVHTMRQ